MRGADVKDHADARRGDLGEVADVPDTAGRHLRHEVARVLITAQSRIRKPNFIVEGAGRGDGLPHLAEDGGDEVLGRGLARRSRHSHDGQILLCRQPLRYCAGQRGQRLDDGGGGAIDIVGIDIGVGSVTFYASARLHDDGGYTHRPGSQDGDGSLLHRGVGVIVAIDAGSGQCHEESTRSDLARIELNKAGHWGLWLVDAIQAAARDLSYLSEA